MKSVARAAIAVVEEEDDDDVEHTGMILILLESNVVSCWLLIRG